MSCKYYIIKDEALSCQKQYAMLSLRIFSFILSFTLIQTSFAQSLQWPALTPQQKQDSLYFLQHYQVRKEMIPMRDGVKLYTEIIVPTDASKARPYPFLMERTPYNASYAQYTLYLLHS